MRIIYFIRLDRIDDTDIITDLVGGKIRNEHYGVN